MYISYVDERVVIKMGSVQGFAPDRNLNPHDYGIHPFVDNQQKFASVVSYFHANDSHVAGSLG